MTETNKPGVWPESIIKEFKTSLEGSTDKALHGAYNKLLHHLFPADSQFTVVPNWLQPLNSQPESTGSMALEVHFSGKPVFILQLNDPATMNYLSTRKSVDSQLRHRMADLAGELYIHSSKVNS
jgi:hypothetical protein